jgi:hypothetical protein
MITFRASELTPLRTGCPLRPKRRRIEVGAADAARPASGHAPEALHAFAAGLDQGDRSGRTGFGIERATGERSSPHVILDRAGDLGRLKRELRRKVDARCATKAVATTTEPLVM